MTQSKSIGWAGFVARMMNKYKIMVGKPERRPLGRLRRRWENNIKMAIRDIKWEVVD
jgi:hypothetical protein